MPILWYNVEVVITKRIQRAGERPLGEEKTQRGRWDVVGVEVSVLIAVVGCLVGLAGWLRNREKQVSEDAEWRGQVNGKLDVIVGIRSDVDHIDRKVDDHAERLSKLEASGASAQKRLDEHIRGGG